MKHLRVDGPRQQELGSGSMLVHRDGKAGDHQQLRRRSPNGKLQQLQPPQNQQHRYASALANQPLPQGLRYGSVQRADAQIARIGEKSAYNKQRLKDRYRSDFKRNN